MAHLSLSHSFLICVKTWSLNKTWSLDFSLSSINILSHQQNTINRRLRLHGKVWVGTDLIECEKNLITMKPIWHSYLEEFDHYENYVTQLPSSQSDNFIHKLPLRGDPRRLLPDIKPTSAFNTLRSLANSWRAVDESAFAFLVKTNTTKIPRRSPVPW